MLPEWKYFLQGKADPWSTLGCQEVAVVKRRQVDVGNNKGNGGPTRT